MAVAEYQPSDQNRVDPYFSEYIRDLAAFINSCRDAYRSNDASRQPDQVFETELNRLARKLFKLQIDCNEVYRKFAESRRALHPHTWREIPAMPTSSFKDFDVTCVPVEERSAVFHSSGTTEQQPSRHFHSAESISAYEMSLKAGFDGAFRKGVPRRFVFLTPPKEQAPHSSLVHMFDALSSRAGSTSFHGSVLADGSWSLELNSLMPILTQSKEPLFLFGTAFNFVHLLDALKARDLKLKLPQQTLALQTGGFKGKSRTLTQAELYSEIRESLGPITIRSEYGMCELSSQAYDDPLTSSDRDTVFVFPPWVRTRIAQPSSTSVQPTGLLEIVDLANIASAVAIQTGDLASIDHDSFKLMGRAQTSEPRGCSLQSATLP